MSNATFQLSTPYREEKGDNQSNCARFRVNIVSTILQSWIIWFELK